MGIHTTDWTSKGRCGTSGASADWLTLPGRGPCTLSSEKKNVTADGRREHSTEVYGMWSLGSLGIRDNVIRMETHSVVQPQNSEQTIHSLSIVEPELNDFLPGVPAVTRSQGDCTISRTVVVVVIVVE